MPNNDAFEAGFFDTNGIKLISWAARITWFAPLLLRWADGRNPSRSN
jgi:hypothetical protein